MIKAIVFDCFGVLVGNGFWDVYDAAGGDSLKDSEFIENILKKANSGTISNEEFRASIAKKIGISTYDYQQVVEHEERPNLPLFKYIKSDLKSKYKIALLSNANRGVIERKIPSRLRALFDEEIISGEVGYLKPDKKIFELTSNRLSVDYEEMVFTDDLQRYLLPASELGMHTLLYAGFEKFRVELGIVLHEFL